MKSIAVSPNHAGRWGSGSAIHRGVRDTRGFSQRRVCTSSKELEDVPTPSIDDV